MFLRQDENVTLCQDGWLILRASNFSKQIQFWIWVLGILTDGIKAALPILRNCLWKKKKKEIACDTNSLIHITFFLLTYICEREWEFCILFLSISSHSKWLHLLLWSLSSHPSSGQSQFFCCYWCCFSPCSPDLSRFEFRTLMRKTSHSFWVDICKMHPKLSMSKTNSWFQLCFLAQVPSFSNG